jgi:putative heme iron utilization protein
MSDDLLKRASEARRLVRASGHAALATTFEDRPYVSLVAVACEMDASPLLLLSDLATHTSNLMAEPRVSLLFQASADHADPLAGPRLTLLGRAQRVNDAPLASRFAARHPASAVYAGFADFHLYRVVIERGHLVAGFGRIAWIDGASLRFCGDTSGLATAEPEIIAHMNADHADALQLYARRLLGLAGEGWRMTGIDPEGLDLRSQSGANGETTRLDFAQPVLTPPAVRRVLVSLAEQARQLPDPS